MRPDLERDLIEVETEVRNVGARTGDAVLQIYAGGETSVSDQPRKRLCGFRRVQLDAGAVRSVKVEVQIRDLASFDPQAGGWRLHTRRWRIFSGASSRNEDLGAVLVSLPERSWKA